MLRASIAVAVDIDNLDLDPHAVSIPIDRELYLSADAELVDLIVSGRRRFEQAAHWRLR